MNIADYIRNKEKKKVLNDNITPQENIDKYSKMNEGELMKELFAKGSVSNGGITPDELDGFYTQASSYLTPEQKQKMKMLIEQLKRS